MAIRVANNQSLTAITALPAAVSGGAMTLLETQTASSSATLDFTSGIDSTYDEYMFKFYDINPATDFYALSDVTMSAEMSTYRQDLRDLPDGLVTVEDVDNVTWPTKP